MTRSRSSSPLDERDFAMALSALGAAVALVVLAVLLMTAVLVTTAAVGPAGGWPSVHELWLVLAAVTGLLTPTAGAPAVVAENQGLFWAVVAVLMLVAGGVGGAGLAWWRRR